MAVVLITGASSGIGAATARAFAARGDKVVPVARSTEALQAVAEDTGGLAVPCDASDGDAVADMAAQVRDAVGVPDVIVNSAGAGAWKRVEDTPPAEAIEMIGAPYLAAFNVTQVFLAEMLARRSGVVVHVGSPAGMSAWPGSAGYAAARGALRSFHEALAQDLVGTGVASCHVMFGEVLSPYFERNAVGRDQLPMLGKLVPRLTPEQCADHIIRLSGRPRHTAVHPVMMRLLVEGARLFPGTTRRLARL